MLNGSPESGDRSQATIADSISSRPPEPARNDPEAQAGSRRDVDRPAAVSVFPRRPSPAEVQVVAAQLTAECGHAPSGAELVAALRAQSGCSRASAYRALRPVRGPRPGRLRTVTGRSSASPPFVAASLMRVPLSVWHKALFDNAVNLNIAMSELFSLLLDVGLAARQISSGIPER
jgi:hypothetical protein